METCASPNLAYNVGPNYGATAQAACSAYASGLNTQFGPLTGVAEPGGCFYYSASGTRMDFGDDITHNCDAGTETTPPVTPGTTGNINCSTACTVTVVHELSLPPLQLDAAGGAQIASAVLAVWALGWGIRMLIRALNIDGKSTSDES